MMTPPMITVDELLHACSGARTSGPERGTFTAITTNSRGARPGEVFIALCGDNFDGHDFIDPAVASGVSAVVCARSRSLQREGVTFIEVDDTLAALGDIAAYHRRRFDIPVVAITGSNGKTTTKEMLRAVLGEAWGEDAVLANRGNFNNLVGLPLTMMEFAERHRGAILEMGMNAPGEIARLCEIAAPTVGLITCVAEAHLQGLGSIEGVATAKAELFAGLDESAIAVVNLADPRVRDKASLVRGRRLSYGPGGRVEAVNIEAEDLERSRFELVFDKESVTVELPIGGRHNVDNALGAAACALAVGLPLATVAAGLAKAEPPPMRLAVENLGNGVRLINDAYNANPASLDAAFRTLASVRDGRRIIVVGDMLELGDEAADWHQRAGAAAAAIEPALLCAMGGHAEDFSKGALEAGLDESSTCVCTTHDEAAAAVAERWRAGDAVLIKGSRGSAMEKVVEALRSKV